MKARKAFSYILGVICLAGVSGAETIRLQEGVDGYEGTSDTTIYELTKNFTNGRAGFFYVGKSGENNNHRAMIRFDLTSIPSTVEIESVELILWVDRAGPGRPLQEPHRINRMLKPWGEGNGNSDDPGGIGVQALDGDATWLTNFFNQSSWENEGGDFDPNPSVTVMVPDPPAAVTFSSAQLTEDVRNWIANPDQNFGWMIRSSETGNKAANRFLSAEGEVETDRPILVINTIDPATATPSQTTTPTPTATATATMTSTPTVTLSPTVTPTISVTPSASSTLTPLATFTFADSAEGWTFSTTDAFNKPTQSVSDDAIKIVTNSPNSFGYWSSPVIDIPETEFFWGAGRVRMNKVAYTVYSDQADKALAPTMRFRVNSPTLESASVLVAESTGNGDYSPGTDPRTYIQYFATPFDAQAFLLSFDSMNFDPADAVQNTVSLDEVVFQREVWEGLKLEGSWNFTNQSHGWAPRNASPTFAVPNTEVTILGLKIGGGLVSNGPERGVASPTIFGFWNSTENTRDKITLHSGLLYFLRFEIATDATASTRINIPTLRLRMNTADLKFSTYGILESIDENAPFPIDETFTSYGTFFYAPAEVDQQEVQFSLDYMIDPNSDNSIDISVYLQSLIVRSYSDIVPSGFFEERQTKDSQDSMAGNIHTPQKSVLNF